MPGVKVAKQVVYQEIADSFQAWLDLGNEKVPIHRKVKVFDKMADRKLKNK